MSFHLEEGCGHSQQSSAGTGQGQEHLIGKGKKSSSGFSLNVTLDKAMVFLVSPCSHPEAA